MQQTITKEPDELARELRTYLRFRPHDSEWAQASESELADHCYTASEAYYHLSGRKEHLTPKQVMVEVDTPRFSGDVSHWFLEDQDGRVIDLTAEQFEFHDIEIPYEDATGRGFVPPSPRMDTAVVIEELEEKPEYTV